MLAIQAHCHHGHIQLPPTGLPQNAKVVVVFLDAETTDTTAPTGATGLSPEQQAALALQSQSNFAQTVLLNPAEDCWNHV